MRLGLRGCRHHGNQLTLPQSLQDAMMSSLCRPEADKGAWNAQNVQFVQPMALTSFAVASFVRPQRAGGPVNDPGSINVHTSCLSVLHSMWHMSAEDSVHRIICE